MKEPPTVRKDQTRQGTCFGKVPIHRHPDSSGGSRALVEVARSGTEIYTGCTRGAWTRTPDRNAWIEMRQRRLISSGTCCCRSSSTELIVTSPTPCFDQASHCELSGEHDFPLVIWEMASEEPESVDRMDEDDKHFPSMRKMKRPRQTRKRQTWCSAHDAGRESVAIVKCR
ncbi:hypothetical protein HETIRDRAFT_318025 [Heterobasidion irregulare TC 32-1]|uniref:Uncharacterized protein n=1 Tax=Heterobasidion irregulare (strain TC 32-1) TaxID=747525 RepID=W4K810_HETIT|nr:uncharacterized protein HETIRDRAFT_318936 [Heterobasidion irregulare TC 32-1]XP_009546513.1 uncharacterized protein HETIRDRAFT_318025 [Heterobasidion irregulare TC 32-1]ETW81884.1 hypothetical protein HETIRDRAFT_318936 [Heterobasidion irregulare TC 32-1]ETW81923.1 hypothetical protein HETIRDRAFT_318025 [Heterobasidion irregulare TC 32-1]